MGVRRGGSTGSNDPPSPKRGHLHRWIFFFRFNSRTNRVVVLVHVRYRYDRGTGNDGKIKLITLSHTCSQLLCPEKSRRKKEKGKKRRQCVKTLQGIPRKQSRWGVVGDDSLTGPVVAGRLDETTASTTDDSTSVSLSGSVSEVPCNTVVVADGRETQHSPILFPVPHSDQRDASGSLLSSEAYSMTYLRIHLHHQLYQS